MLVKIDQVIRNITMGESYSWDKYNLYLSYIIRGLRELSMHAATPKTVYLTLDAAKVAKLPADFMRLSKLGLVYSGRINVLTVDPNIVSPKETLWTCEDGSVVATPPPGGSAAATYQFASFDAKVGRIVPDQPIYGYGKGMNPDGVYRIDYQNWQIQFSSGVTEGSEGLALEYITNGLDENPDGETYVDERAFETLVAWVKWKVEEDMPSQKAKLADREYWKKQYLANKYNYTVKKFAINFQDLEWFADSSYSLSAIRPRI